MLALSASLVVALLASSSLPLVSATVVVPPACEDDFCLKDLTTCKFSIHFPTSADPKYTSELIHGSFKVQSAQAGHARRWWLSYWLPDQVAQGRARAVQRQG